MTETIIETDVFCPACGYNLRGSDSARCPECGLEIDRAQIGASVLPWTSRAGVGWFSALFRTIHLITRRPTFAAREAAAPVKLREAQRFRLIVILLAATPLIIAAIVLRVLVGDAMIPIPSLQGGWPTQPLPWWIDFFICFIVGLRMWIVPSCAILLTFAALTGAASYFFDIRNGALTITQRNRAVAMSFYACAPLAYLPIPLTLAAITTLLNLLELDRRAWGFNVFALLIVFTTAAVLFVFGSWYHTTLRLLRRTTYCSNPRVILVALLVPILWVLFAAMGLIGFPMLCGYIKLLVLGLVE